MGAPALALSSQDGSAAEATLRKAILVCLFVETVFVVGMKVATMATSTTTTAAVRAALSSRTDRLRCENDLIGVTGALSTAQGMKCVFLCAAMVDESGARDATTATTWGAMAAARNALSRSGFIHSFVLNVVGWAGFPMHGGVCLFCRCVHAVW